MHSFGPLLAELQALQSRVSLGQNHQYRADGKHMPGVTTVIGVLDSPALTRWKVKTQAEGTARASFDNPPLENEPREEYVARMRAIAQREFEHERLADEAARIGTGVHQLIEHAVKKMLGEVIPAPVVPEESVFRFAGWREWANDVGLTPLASEARLFHKTLNYCGTLDLLCMLKSDGSVVDFKPQSSVYTSRRLQLAGYRMALESMGFPVLRGFLNVLPRDGGDITMVEVDPPGPSYKASCEAFENCLALYRWNAEHEKQSRKSKREAA